MKTCPQKASKNMQPTGKTIDGVRRKDNLNLSKGHEHRRNWRPVKTKLNKEDQTAKNGDDELFLRGGCFCAEAPPLPADEDAPTASRLLEGGRYCGRQPKESDQHG